MRWPIAICLSLLFTPLTPLAKEAVAPEAATETLHRVSRSAQEHMVVAANPYASRAGLAILREGGSAMDAAIAMQWVLNVVEPQSSGIGGGAFLLHFDSDTEQLTSLDGRETAPLAATPELFLKEDGSPMGFFDAVVGGRSVGTPGTLALMWSAHQRWGKLPWARLFEPAIELAEEGFIVSPRLAGLVSRDAARLASHPETKAYFLPDGQAIHAGQTLRNPALAATFRTVAEQGPKAFYTGEIAEDIVAAVSRHPSNPGLLSKDDLARYEVVERAPVCVAYQVFDICGMGPPSSGGLAVGQIMGMLRHFPMSDQKPMDVKPMHWFVEASRLAYADRARYMADSDFVDVPVAGLLDEDYLAERAALIGEQAMPSVDAGTPPAGEAMAWADDQSLELPSTSHLVVADSHGNAVSMTTTIENAFGSRTMVRGFLLNNELTDFSFVPEKDGRPVANRVEPGKRPRSSMAPTIVLGPGGKPFMLVGSPGGSRIIPYVAQTLIAVLDWGLDPQSAVTLPHVLSRGGPVEIEADTAAIVLAEPLRRNGHEVLVRELNSGIHLLLIHEAGLIGGADPRREGLVLGD